jgi:hypothetical protein
MHRRTWFRSVFSMLALLPFQRFKVLRAQNVSLSEEHVATLRSVATVVLPTSLEPTGAAEVAEKFVQWVHEYRSGIPYRHGYGDPSLRRTPPFPIEAYVRQLEVLEQAAKEQGQSFARLAPPVQRAVVESALDKTEGNDLPRRPTGEHVITDLMGFYFRSSEANDLCYRADIGRYKCRPLARTTKRPRPL